HGGVATPAHGKREGPVGSEFRDEAEGKRAFTQMKSGTKITMGGYEGAKRLSPPWGRLHS
ncbi:MAG: hypothetical protein J5668_05200, partial [Bacteroidales bacterium]|nr:hypothetical protein [Bacteroidales bacterium]